MTYTSERTSTCTQMCVCACTHRPRINQDNTQRDTLQHTAPHCNTPQFTALHCPTLPHTALHCNTLQHTTTHCSKLQHSCGRCLCRREQCGVRSLHACTHKLVRLWLLSLSSLTVWCVEAERVTEPRGIRKSACRTETRIFYTWYHENLGRLLCYLPGSLSRWPGVLQCVLQCVLLCVLQCVLQCFIVWCSIVHCVAVRCILI